MSARVAAASRDGGWRALLRGHAEAGTDARTQLLLAAVVAIAAWVSCAPLLGRDLFFHADDWDWLARAHFYQGADQSGWLPQKPYNDRPVGALLIRIGYRAFGLDAQAFHVAAVCLHAINSVLALVLALRLLPPHRALVAGVLSAAWFAANDAVGWTAAVFDLAGATFCLGAVLLYGLEGRRQWLWRLGALACHVLAIRTKEFGLGLVVALAAWELLVAPRWQWARLLPHVAVTLVYGVAYLILLADAPTRGGPYALSWSPVAMAESLWAYMRMLGGGHAWAAWLLAGVALAHVAMRNRAGLFATLAALAVLAAVLPLASQRYAFYLYAPHFFAAISIAALGFGRVGSVLAAVLAIVLVGTPLLDGSRARALGEARSQGRYAAALHRDFVAWADGRGPLRGVVVQVRDPAASPFLQGHARLTRFNPWLLGPGNAIKMAVDNPHAQARVTADLAQAQVECRALRLPLLVEREGRLVEATREASCLAPPGDATRP